VQRVVPVTVTGRHVGGTLQHLRHVAVVAFHVHHDRQRRQRLAIVVVVVVVVVAQQHVHRVLLVGSTGQSIDGEMQFSGGGRDEGVFQDSVATFVHGIDVGLADVQQIFRHFVVPLRQTAHQWRQALPIADVRAGPCEILMEQIQLSKVSQTSVKHRSNIRQTSTNIDKHRHRQKDYLH